MVKAAGEKNDFNPAFYFEMCGVRQYQKYRDEHVAVSEKRKNHQHLGKDLARKMEKRQYLLRVMVVCNMISRVCVMGKTVVVLSVREERGSERKLSFCSGDF